MMRRSLCTLLFATSLFAAASRADAQPAQQLHWQPWSDAAFAQARTQHKFVLLDLEAVWCHWCHVMDDITYKDPDVIRLLNAKYVLVKVDQDARPDISNRYQDYGWPATVVFAADASEIVKRQGYMPPKEMASMLQAIIDDPSPGPSVQPEEKIAFSSSSAVTPALFTQLMQNYDAQYDAQATGWGFGHKYLDGDSVEYAMRLAQSGNATYSQRAQATLHNAKKLIDPAWGGMYQYSVDGNWDEPHYEKLISIQASAIRAYSLAYAQWHTAEYARAAQSIHFYVHTFLTDPATGAFFVSQDADLVDGEENAGYFALNDASRRAKGIPRVDKHEYARENGWMIAALAQLYANTGDATGLTEATRATNWVIANRSLGNGGFRHDLTNAAGPYLGDTLAMGQAFLALYTVTGDAKWLAHAESARAFIAANFAPHGSGGFITSKTPGNAAFSLEADRDENAQLLRFANLLSQITGNAADHATAERAMRYLATKQILLKPLSAPSLLAVTEYQHDAIHVTILGAKDDAGAAALYTTALRSLTGYERLEWRVPGTRSTRPNDVEYPPLSKAATFLCTARACSSPIFTTAELQTKLDHALATQPK
jgi:uncharacterized protein YyaL (SSP411 family)